MTLHSWSEIFRSTEQINAYCGKVREIDEGIGSFLSFMAEDHQTSPLIDGPLKGIPFAVKDNIAVKNRIMTCGSKILKNFISPYSASAVLYLEAAGARVVGKTNLDEFGMGSSNEHSALGVTVNPWNRDCVPGGSSGGSAAAVAADLVPLALGSDTGGSVRQPANFCGVYGLKPTYGTISRYGLTAYASSLEVIGTMSKDIDLMELSYSLMSGADENDQSSINSQKLPENNKRVAVLEIDEGILDDPVLRSYKDSQRALADAGYHLSPFTLSTLEYVIPAYYTIASAEAGANLARFNGIRYGSAPEFAGNPAELMRKARHEGFGDEVKLRILLGTFVLRSGFQDQYYLRAQKIRTLIRRELKEIFKNCDSILMPVFPTQAFGRDSSGMDKYQQRLADVFTCFANLAGIPALAIPTELEASLPTGIQLAAPSFGEKRLFEAARDLAKIFPIGSPECALNLEVIQ